MKKRERVIKRYRNRKLYDTLESCYVTLEDISEMIKLGDEVTVIDNRNSSDITGVTLAQIIFEEQKNEKSSLPLNTLKSLVQHGGSAIKGLFQKTMEGRGEFIKEEIGAILERHIHHAALDKHAKKSVVNSVMDFIEHKVKPTIEHAQKTPDVQDDIRSLRFKIDQLESKLKDS